MELWYEGKDITDRVEIHKALWRDQSRGRADSLELELGWAEKWGAWGVKMDDRLEIKGKGYRTGTMYVSAVMPEGGSYRVFATAVPAKGKTKKWESFTGKSLGEIVKKTAEDAGMEYKIWGVEAETVYPYLMREDETAAAFLERVARNEGAAIKCYDGKIRMIGLKKAQEMEAQETLELSYLTGGCQYLRRWDLGTRVLTLYSPYGQAKATDKGESGREKTVWCEARSNAEAKRWALGRLLAENRLRERITLQSDFTPRWTALGRIDVEGPASWRGKWTIDEVEHDLIGEKSQMVLLKNVEEIE